MQQIHHKTNNDNYLKPTLKKVALAVLATLNSYAHANSSRLVNPANNHAYQRLDSALEWNTAKTVCSNMGSTLATITSAAENTWITNNFATGVNGFWLGATDEVQEGTWKWITNEPWSYTNWNSGEPGGGTNENYLLMWGNNNIYGASHGTWNDCKLSCDHSDISTYLCEWEPDTTVNVYSNDFSTSAGAEWTDPTIATSNGEKFLGASANGFGAGSNTLTVNNLPAHTKVKVDFDVYMIQTWDGNSEVCGIDICPPNNWQLTVDGVNLLFTNFANYATGNTQAYPNQLPPYGSGGFFAARTGAFANGHLGFGTGDWGDATYRLSYTFAHTAASVALKFISMQDSGPGDEGWGLDNVRVSVLSTALPAVVTTAPSVITVTSARLNGSVNPNGSATNVSFDFGLTSTYGQNIVATPASIAATAAATNVSTNKTGLTCGTTYHYRVKAINSAGTRYGANKTFVTNPCTTVRRDLVITGITLTPATPVANGSFNVAVTVKNTGVYSSNDSFLDVWSNRAAAATCGMDGNKWVEVGALAAGASKVLNVSAVPAGAAGAKTLRAFVDSWCEVVEANEANNQLIKTYTVQ